MKKRITALAIVAVGALALTGCGQQAEGPAEEPAETAATGEGLEIDGEQIADAELYAAATEEGTLTLYDNYPEGPWRALLDVFEEDTGITVEHLRLVTPQLYERALSEAGAGQVGADAIGLGDVTLMNDMAERGILEPFDSEVGMDALEEEQYAEDRTWYSTARLVMVPGYNEQVLEQSGLEVPTSWEGLLDPQWAEQVGVTPIETGGSAYSAYHFMREVDEGYWQGLAANSPRLYESVVPLTQDIVRGELPIGVTSLGTIATQRAEGAPVLPVFLEEGTPAFANMVGVTADAEHPSAARVYVNWLLSLRGQNTLVELLSEYPIRSDANSPTIEGVEVPPADSDEIVVPPFEAWTENRDAYTEEWNAVFR